jgi:hypothetical protein
MFPLSSDVISVAAWRSTGFGLAASDDESYKLLLFDNGKTLWFCRIQNLCLWMDKYWAVGSLVAIVFILYKW